MGKFWTNKSKLWSIIVNKSGWYFLFRSETELEILWGLGIIPVFALILS